VTKLRFKRHRSVMLVRQDRYFWRTRGVAGMRRGATFHDGNARRAGGYKA